MVVDVQNYGIQLTVNSLGVELDDVVSGFFAGSIVRLLSRCEFVNLCFLMP